MHAISIWFWCEIWSGYFSVHNGFPVKKREVCLWYSELCWNWVWWADEEHSGASADSACVCAVQCVWRECDRGQCRCPEGRVDAPLHDVSPHQTGLPTVPQFQYLTQNKKGKPNTLKRICAWPTTEWMWTDLCWFEVIWMSASWKYDSNKIK